MIEKKVKWTKVKSMLANTDAYTLGVKDGTLTVLVSIDNGMHHMSISHAGRHRAQTRYPNWNEIAEARYTFTPDDITMAMLLPPKAEYVNIHATTFHLWEIPNG